MQQSTCKIILIILNILFTLSIIPWTVMAYMLFIAVYSSGSSETFLLWLLVISISAYAPVGITGIIFSWISFKREKQGSALLLSALPFIIIAPALFLLTIE